MRKLILASVMMLMATAFSFGQMDIGFGPKIGLNLTNMTNSNMRIKPGIVVGAFANMRINDYLGVQPEILFSMQGTKKNDYTLKMNYFNIPIMAKAYMWKGLNLELGPQFGFRTKASSEEGDISVNVKNETKIFDFAIGVGLAYETEMGLTAGFRYLISATKVIDHEKNKNSVFQLTLGWMF